jgi:hypothetical protein
MLHNSDRRSKNATIRAQFSKEMPTMNETMNEDRYDDTVCSFNSAPCTSLPIKLSLYALLHLWPQNNIRIPSFFYYVSYHKTAKANTTLYTIVLYIHQVKILRTHKNIPHPITRDSTECRKTTLLIFSYQTTKSNVPEGESVSTSIQLFYHDDDDRKCHGIMMNS